MAVIVTTEMDARVTNAPTPQEHQERRVPAMVTVSRDLINRGGARNVQRAIEVLNTQKDMPNPHIQTTLAEAFSRQGQYSLALEVYKHAATLAQVNPEVQMLIQGQTDTTIPQRWLQEGIAHMQKTTDRTDDDIDAALHLFDLALTVVPADPRLEYEKGNALLQRGRIEEAMTSLQRARSVFPANQDIQRAIQLATTQEQAFQTERGEEIRAVSGGRYAEALPLFAHLSRRYSEDAGFLRDWGRALIEVGGAENITEAIRILQQAKMLNTIDAGIATRVGRQFQQDPLVDAAMADAVRKMSQSSTSQTSTSPAERLVPRTQHRPPDVAPESTAAPRMLSHPPVPSLSSESQPGRGATPQESVVLPDIQIRTPGQQGVLLNFGGDRRIVLQQSENAQLQMITFPSNEEPRIIRPTNPGETYDIAPQSLALVPFNMQQPSPLRTRVQVDRSQNWHVLRTENTPAATYLPTRSQRDSRENLLPGQAYVVEQYSENDKISLVIGQDRYKKVYQDGQWRLIGPEGNLRPELDAGRRPIPGVFTDRFNSRYILNQDRRGTLLIIPAVIPGNASVIQVRRAA